MDGESILLKGTTLLNLKVVFYRDDSQAVIYDSVHHNIEFVLLYQGREIHVVLTYSLWASFVYVVIGL